MEISQRPELRQTLSVQAQQSLALLQAPTMELQALIRKELESNPLLEEVPPEGEGELGGEVVDEWKTRLDRLMEADHEWRDYFSQDNLRSPRDLEGEEKRQHLLDSLTPPVSLDETLREQVRATDLPEELWEVADLLIGNLDERGYLKPSVAELAFSTNRDPEEIRRCLETLQSCDPPGVACRDLRECLMRQLERDERQESLEYRILDHHFDDLARRNLTRLAELTGADAGEVREAVDRIVRLDPRPGNRFTEHQSLYVVPEVIVTLDEEGEPVVALDREPVPRLRISNTYKDLLSRAESSGELRDYVREKIRSGKFLMSSVAHRQETIERVAIEMVRRQREFFTREKAPLVPMTMSEVARSLDIHETTVSRAVSGKYLSCHRGVLSLRSFFTAGVAAAGGGAISNRTIKDWIGRLVREEDPVDPLTDGDLVERLAGEGIRVARRTVNKYRKLLRIPSSHQRRVR